MKVLDELNCRYMCPLPLSSNTHLLSYGFESHCMIDKRTAEDKKDKGPSEEGDREMGKRKQDELSYKRRQQIHERNEGPGPWAAL
jgi:hypothetical protein